MTENLIVYEQSPFFLDFASKQLDVPFDPSTARTISHVLLKDGKYEILAVVVYTGWLPNSVELSIASSKGRWATRRFIRAVYEYAFTHANKDRIHMVVEPSNVESVEMHIRLGHKYEGCLDDWFGEDRPVFIYGLTRRNYQKGKWSLNKENKK